MTLNCCKPRIRKAAEVGDWVAATTAADFPGGQGLLVYTMRIAAKMTMSDYDAWTQENLPEKLPSGARGPYERQAGDSMYRFDSHSGEARRDRRGFHKPFEMETDLRGRYTLLSEDFYYFGGSPISIPEHLRPVIHTGRNHRSNLNDPYVGAFEDWVRTLDPGLHGIPHLAPRPVEIGRR